MKNKIISFLTGPILASLIGFITLPFITHLVTPNEFAKINLFLVTQQVIYIFIYIAMDHAYVREYNEIKNKSVLLGHVLVIPSVLSLLLGIVLYMCSEIFSEFLFGEVDSFLIICLGIILPLAVIERFAQLTVRMQERGALFSFLMITSKFSILLIIFIFLLLDSMSFKNIILSYLIAQLISSLLSLFFIKSFVVKDMFKINKSLLSRLIKYALPLFPATIIVWSMNYISLFILRGYSDFYELGIFSGGVRIISVITIFQTAIMSLWVPIAYRWNSENRSVKLFDGISYIIMLLSIILIILMFLFKGLIIYILSPDYIDVIYIISMLMLVPFFSLISEILGIGINFARKTYWNTIISIICLIFLLIFSFYLIPSYGAKGAAIANAIAYLIYFIARFVISSKLWINYRASKYYLLVTIVVFLSILNSIYVYSTLILIINLVVLFIVITVLIIFCKNNRFLFKNLQ